MHLKYSYKKDKWDVNETTLGMGFSFNYFIFIEKNDILNCAKIC